MSYIVTAEAYTGMDCEKNIGADASKVDARILSLREGKVTFDVRGEHGKEAEIVRALCISLIDAGFFEFSIGHSY